jgi:hypothetical protein
MQSKKMRRVDIFSVNRMKYSLLFKAKGVTILGEENKVQYVKYTDIKELDL